MTSCKSLYVLCLEFCIPRIENYSRKFLKNENVCCDILESLAGPVIEDLLKYAYQTANKNIRDPSKRIWKNEWKILLTAKISSALLSWDSELIDYVSRKCTNLKNCTVVSVENFHPDSVSKLPPTVTSLDFDREFIKIRQTTDLSFSCESYENREDPENWLHHAERILKTLKTPPFDHLSSSNFLSELHLSTVKVSVADLKLILRQCPSLNLLRNYQMVRALYELHSNAWKNKEKLPKYNLRNLDVDFSHVVRCRMSPEWILSPNALQLAVALCPSANSIRVRFDCSTPHDVLSPLTDLTELKDFSIVCVSSGERTLLDFSDMVPVIEKHGPNSMTCLELKVIEEVEIHEIIKNCTNLDTLILSGCGYVTPSRCSSFECHRYAKGTFRRLKFLFYADGDDFSWDHGVPECFWKASLCSSDSTRDSQIRGLFLENPRISLELSKEIFLGKSGRIMCRSPFPRLQTLSLCRYEELTTEDVASICGLNSNPSTPCQSLQYIRLSQCEQITKSEEIRLRRWLKNGNLNVKIDIDR